MNPFDSFSRKLVEQADCLRIASTCKACGLIIVGSVTNGLLAHEAEHLLGVHSDIIPADQKNGFVLYESIRRVSRNTIFPDQTLDYLLQLETALKQQVEGRCAP